MRKFGDIYKEKLNESEELQETKVLSDFRQIYNVMLEHYGLSSVHELNDPSQLSFLTELNHYWSEEKGLSEKGEKFIAKRSMTLNENSTTVQKKNYLKLKATSVLKEVLRQSDLKFKFYDIVDEMYKQVNASNLNETLSPQSITLILESAFKEAAGEFISKVNFELKESAKPKKKFIVKVKAK